MDEKWKDDTQYPSSPIHSTVTYLISCRTDTHVWTMKCLPCYNNYWEHFSPFVFSFWFRVLICSFMCRVFFRSKMVINTLTMLCPALYPSLSFLSSESFFMRACLFVLWVVSSWACLFVHCIKSLGFFVRLPRWCTMRSSLMTQFKLMNSYEKTY